ncbi:MAG TPA: hypothetical protein VHN78_13725, partial [Chloroflexota bacterium]|nr:hypothetical protein [Chloroflexota bacterium]
MQRPFLEDYPKTEAPTTPLPSLPAHPRKLVLTRGGELQVVHVVPPGCRPPPEDGERGRPRTARAFAPVMAQRFGAFFMVVEGIPPSAADLFHRRVRQALSVERGLTTSRLMRAVSAGCEAVEGQLLHRYQLAAFGVTAVLVESTLHPYVSMSQLPPGQAYLLDTGVLKAIPEEQMWRAEQVASPEGRSWPVELDLERLTVHPGATIMLCSSVLGARLSATTVKEVLQLPLEQATQALFEAWREVTRRQDLSELGEALLIRFPESETQPRVRLFAPPAEASRRLAAAPPAARRFSGDAAVRDPEASWIDPPLHRWGLEGERQPAIPILGSVIDWVTGVQRAVP